MIWSGRRVPVQGRQASLLAGLADFRLLNRPDLLFHQSTGAALVRAPALFLRRHEHEADGFPWRHPHSKRARNESGRQPGAHASFGVGQLLKARAGRTLRQGLGLGSRSFRLSPGPLNRMNMDQVGRGVCELSEQTGNTFKSGTLRTPSQRNAGRHLPMRAGFRLAQPELWREAGAIQVA